MTTVATPLFRTKISIPPLRPPLVLRPQLSQRLNEGLQRRLTLVSAPAGYGKTTLLAEWAASAPAPVAWLGLDNEDNDPDQFCTCFWGALDRIFHSPSWPARPTLAGLPLQAALQRMLYTLEQEEQSLALVLDDYQSIHNPDIHQALAAFLERLPPYVHLYIATRKDPPVPLARLRARGELGEVRAEQLRFSLQESAAFLEQKMGLRLADEDHVILARRTEGWAAGLQLAALMLSERADPHLFIQSISGSHPFILDYLVEEVLCTLPEDIHSFLLQTSLLHRLNAPLCAALTATSTAVSARILNDIEKANLFLTPLDAERQWFRYHHLFAELLQRRLHDHTSPEQVNELHLRAANWYQAAGEPVEAIHHAVLARSWPAAAEMMAFWGTEFFKTGAIGTYLPMLRALPPEELRRHPQLVQDMGWALALTNDLDQADQFLKLAEEMLPDQPNFLGETLSGRAYVACFQFKLSRTLELSRQALALLETENEWMRSVVHMVSGLAHWFTGDPFSTQQDMVSALQAARRAGSPRVQKTALAYLGRTKAMEMDFLSAEELALSAIGDDPQPQLSPGNDVPAFDLAALYYEWNELDAAARYLELGFQANEASGNNFSRVSGLRIQARLRQAQGHNEEAWKAAQQAVQLSTEMGLAPSFHNLNAACCVELALAQGNLSLAKEWAERITDSGGLDPFHPLPLLARVRLLLSVHQIMDARRLLSELDAQATGSAFQFARFRVRLHQALAEPQRAREFLTADLPTAYQQKLVRSFIYLGEPAAAILRALPLPAEAELAERFAVLLNACQGNGAAGSIPTPAQPVLPPLVEPLSERELDVLRAMAGGLNTKEIAGSLYLAESTVRSHIKNIFAKLDVHSRLQAVEQARRRQLL